MMPLWCDKPRTQHGRVQPLVAKYQDRFVNLCWRVCGNPDDAQDLAQEAFLHAIEKNRHVSVCVLLLHLAVPHRGETVILAPPARPSARSSLLGRVRRCWSGTCRTARGRRTAAARLAGPRTLTALARALDRLDTASPVVVLRDIESLVYHQFAQVLE